MASSPLVGCELKELDTEGKYDDEDSTCYDAPNNAPVVTVPGKPAQKLIREGNVYVLYNDKLYNMQGVVK